MIFHPNKTWRKWYWGVNNIHKWYAVASSIASSTVVSLVMLQKYYIEDVTMTTLVLSDDTQGVKKISGNKIILTAVVGIYNIIKSVKSNMIWDGKGKT